MKEMVYRSPFESRYASKEMLHLLSEQNKFTTWRQLWLALAKKEMELGLPISQEQIDELSRHVSDIDFIKSAEYEGRFRHDVMAHVHTYGDAAPSARGIIHLGATSAFVGDNGDLIVFRDGLKLIERKLKHLLVTLADFCMHYRDLPTLGFTHFQPAQVTTVGKRASLWLYDFFMDYELLLHTTENLQFRGVKGTTGTQASFLELFSGDHDKVKELDQSLAKAFGFEKSLPLTGQTYTRKQDSNILHVLRSLAESSHKMTNDLRLLQHLKEVEEPFNEDQIGSSAMAYKRNPMRSERVSALSKFVISLSLNPSLVHATQWFERTLDDSANRRLSMSEAFLAVDSILIILENIVKGLVVHPKMIEKRLQENLPYMMTENILMEAVKEGGDRQALHERIRKHSIESQKRFKEGEDNDLLARLLADDEFHLTNEKLKTLMDASLYVGRSAEQVEEFVTASIDPLREHLIETDEKLKV